MTSDMTLGEIPLSLSLSCVRRNKTIFPVVNANLIAMAAGNSERRERRRERTASTSERAHLVGCKSNILR